jgi:heme/copper-type cytochrome/quinol oxidase subunit 4
MIIKVLLLAALLKLLIVSDKPLLCAVLYTVVAFGLNAVMWIAGDTSIFVVLFLGVVQFLCSFVYFWLLYRIGEGALWWGVLIVGLAIGMV